MTQGMNSSLARVTNVRLAYASAAAPFFVGVFMLVRADDRLQSVVGLVLLVAALGVRAGARRAQDTTRR